MTKSPKTPNLLEVHLSALMDPDGDIPKITAQGYLLDSDGHPFELQVNNIGGLAIVPTEVPVFFSLYQISLMVRALGFIQTLQKELLDRIMVHDEIVVISREHLHESLQDAAMDAWVKNHADDGFYEDRVDRTPQGRYSTTILFHGETLN